MLLLFAAALDAQGQRVGRRPALAEHVRLGADRRAGVADRHRVPGLVVLLAAGGGGADPATHRPPRRDARAAVRGGLRRRLPHRQRPLLRPARR